MQRTKLISFPFETGRVFKWAGNFESVFAFQATSKRWNKKSQFLQILDLCHFQNHRVKYNYYTNQCLTFDKQNWYISNKELDKVTMSHSSVYLIFKEEWNDKKQCRVITKIYAIVYEGSRVKVTIVVYLTFAADSVSVHEEAYNKILLRSPSRKLPARTVLLVEP